MNLQWWSNWCFEKSQIQKDEKFNKTQLKRWNRPKVDCVQIAIGVFVEYVERFTQIALRSTTAHWTVYFLLCAAFTLWRLVFLEQLPELVKTDAAITCAYTHIPACCGLVTQSFYTTTFNVPQCESKQPPEETWHFSLFSQTVANF